MASFYPAVHSVEGPNFPPRAFIVQIKANQIATHLAKGLAPLYLVAGEEPLVLQETLDAIRAAARKAGFSEREVLDVERGRSEEHTSELQSLMRISYAVFCLKKKKIQSIQSHA